MKRYSEKRHYDVAVIGGGAAGVSAAIAAAKNGAKTVLVESSSVLGGDLLSGLPIDGCLSSRGEWIVGGISGQLFDQLKKQNGYVGHISDKRALWVVMINPRIMAFTILRELQKAGISLMLYTHAMNVIKTGNAVCGVGTVNKQGNVLITAEVIIDCTGDGDIAAMAGAEYELGGDQGELQPVSIVFHMANMDKDKLLAFVRDNPQNCSLGENDHLGKGAAKLAQDLYDQGVPKVFFVGEGPLLRDAIASGELYPCSIIAFTPNNMEMTEVAVNSTRVANVNALETERFSSTLMELGCHVEKCSEFLIRHVPGFENAYLTGIAPRAGVRETRRIIGDYVLSTQEVLEGAKSDMGICKGGHEFDIHGAGTAHQRMQIKDAGSYDIPYGCLLPKGLDRILVAGRCLSSDRGANSSARVMGTCMAMGQAAGTAAALSITQKCEPRELDVQMLRKRLTEQGAILDGTY